jgi:hypothetical protein
MIHSYFSIVQANLQIVLSIILLSHVSMETAYVKDVEAIPEKKVYAGMPPFNMTLAFSDDGLDSLPFYFTLYTSAFLQDSRQAILFQSTTQDCKTSGNNCHSYIMPGGLDTVVHHFSNGLTFNPIQFNQSARNGATTFVTVNASTYQLEYFQVQKNVSFDFDTDCTILGTQNVVAVLICLTNVDDDLVAGNLLVGANTDDRMDYMPKSRRYRFVLHAAGAMERHI